MKKEEEKRDRFVIAYAISLITQIGITVSVITVSFIGFGYWADRYFGTLPVFVIIGAVLAFAFSMYAVYRLVLPITEKEGKKDKNNNG